MYQMNIVLCTTDPNYSFSTEKRKENVQLDFRFSLSLSVTLKKEINRFNN